MFFFIEQLPKTLIWIFPWTSPEVPFEDVPAVHLDVCPGGLSVIFPMVTHESRSGHTSGVLSFLPRILGIPTRDSSKNQRNIYRRNVDFSWCFF